MFCKLNMKARVTSDMRADEAVPRLYGSMARKVSKRLTADGANSLHFSLRELSYACWGLNMAA